MPHTTFFFFLSILSLSPIPFNRPPQYFSLHLSAFTRISFHDDLFSHGSLFLDFLRAIIFSPSHLPSPFPRLTSPPAASSHAATSDLTLSSYVSSILHPRHLSSHRPRASLTVRRTLESHKALRRIFHAAISASRDERRYSSRRPIRPKKNGKISTRSDEISLASYQTS